MFICYVIVVVYQVVRDDISKKYNQKVHVVELEIQKCKEEFFQNKCQPETRALALSTYCFEKEICMTQDPYKAVQSSIMSAGLLSQVLNELIEPLTVKTIIFILVFLFGLIMACNCGLGYRRQSNQQIETEKKELALKKRG